MTQILRQSTQVVVRIGPFVDVTDGFTPETGVALSSADEAELLKAAGAAVTDISGATWAAISGADGWYDLTLTTSHTDTIGTLDVVVQDDSVCLPVFARFQVIEEAVYDDIYASAADGIGTVITDTEAILVDTENAISERTTLLTDTEAILTDTGTTLLADTEAILSDTEASQTAETSILADTEAILTDTESLSVSGLAALASGTAQAGTSSTIQLAASETFADDELNGNIVKITSGTGAGQARLITDYTSSTDTATISPNWTTNPSSDSVYEVVEGSVNLAAVSLTAQTAGDIIADTEAVLADTEAILVDTGTTLDTNITAILADTEASQTAETALLADTEAILVDTGTTLDANITAILTDTEAAITERSTLLTDTEAVLADSEAILADTELWDSAQSEPTGVPTSNAAPLTKLGVLYMMARNKIETTASKKTYYGDDDAAEFEKDLSDDGTTYQETKLNAI